MCAVSGAGAGAANCSRPPRAVTGAVRAASGNSGTNGSSSGCMATILAVRIAHVSRHASAVGPRPRDDRRVAYHPGVEALVARLSQLNAETEGALRVVTFYDTLMRRRVGLPALARASAGLAE